MPQNKTTTTKAPKSTLNLKQIMAKMLIEINKLEKEQDPELLQQYLDEVADTHMMIFNNRKIELDFEIGFYKFKKRAKRRATRKPLTIAKARSLAEDLYQLATIFKI
ncbi:MAG: hypothetical protein WEA58_04665 [Balneolaceae bacterium]